MAAATPDGSTAAAGSKPGEVRRVAVPTSLRPQNVVVLVMSGANLAAHDRNGSSDPFVRVTYGKQKARTKTVQRSLNPTWNEGLLFEPYDAAQTSMHVECVDHDLLTANDFIGGCDVDVAALADDKVVEGTYKLVDKNGGEAGTVSLRIKRGQWSDEQVASMQP